MVQQQILERRLLRGFDLLAVADDYHAVGDRSLATGNQLGLHRHASVRLLLANLDEAHAATGHNRECRVPTIVRNFHADALCRLHAVDLLVGADFDRMVVNVNRWHKSK
jgi:hypothetical protein